MWSRDQVPGSHWPAHQDDPLQEPELGEGEVRGSDGGAALLAHDAQTHVRLLEQQQWSSSAGAKVNRKSS